MKRDPERVCPGPWHTRNSVFPLDRSGCWILEIHFELNVPAPPWATRNSNGATVQGSRGGPVDYLRRESSPPATSPLRRPARPSRLAALRPLQTHNAAKLNNAWWRCVKSGQRNSPVSICLCRPWQGSNKTPSEGRTSRRGKLAALSVPVGRHVGNKLRPAASNR